MPYTPPVYNAVIFNFTGTYTPPVYNNVIFNFGASGGSVGDAIISFSDEAEPDLYTNLLGLYAYSEDSQNNDPLGDNEELSNSIPSFEDEWANDFGNYMNQLFGGSEGALDQASPIFSGIIYSKVEYGVWLGDPEDGSIAKFELGAWLGDPDGFQIAKTGFNLMLEPPLGFTVSKRETGFWLLKHKRRYMGFIT